MKILVISYRAPGFHLRGDQSRLALLLRDLPPEHSVTLVTTQRLPAAPPRPCRVDVVAPSLTGRVLSALHSGLRGQPLQVGWSMPRRAWAQACARAADADVAYVVTSRSIRGALPIPIVVDHVDALSLNMRYRSRLAGGLAERVVAALEARLLSGWERQVARWSSAQIAVSDIAAAALPADPAPVVIPAAWDGESFAEPPGHVRDIDCIFTGDMRYPPNRDAAEWLARDVLPLIRGTFPSVRAVFVGRGASTLDVRGAETAADVPDVGAYLRRAKVALVAAEGAGSPFKTLEAAANGVAIVARPWAVDCYGMPALRAETAEEFARHAVGLLEDEGERRKWSLAALPALEAQRSSLIAARFEAVLAAAADVTAHSSDS